MTDAPSSATPMPAQPAATVTNPAAPFLPADSLLPVFVPPPVTDPVSNLDFLPVDDAFALEMRAETIEQLAGGDALRRGASERIEAGRSQTNADLVAGRDRARVQGTLHEHTGHGLAEQAAHLHTTVDGRLDVHADSEDTVLLAGHMRDLWDGGAAIVAAMTDDTVGGGGIRVTTPLDLWVHGLMGVEERIGTCTADAVLMELGATHYEREYGPGVHAAGLAVYAGSLYQSNRSTFRPLMRVSSGVRNLIAGGGGGGGGGHRGAGDAPAASPPPVPAETGAATESATGSLAAGRRTVEAPATALDTADALTDARPAPLEELVNPVDARATDEMGEAGAVMRAEDLPELTRSADTAERLGALRETPRMNAAESGSETAGGFRASELEGPISMDRAGGGGGPFEIEHPSAVYGENAHMVLPHPDVPWGRGPEMKLGLLGGADRPPRSAAPEPSLLAVHRRMRDLRSHYTRLARTDIARDIYRASQRVTAQAVRTFRRFGGSTEELAMRPAGITAVEQAILALREVARQAERDGDLVRAGAIRRSLDGIHERAVGALQALSTKYGIAELSSNQAMQRPPATARPTVAVAVIPPMTVMPPVTGGAAPVPVGSLDQGSIGHPTHVPGVPGLPPASGLPGPSLAEAIGAEASDLGRWRLDPPATVSGSTAAHPAITETPVTPSIAGTSSFWPQPADPVPAPGSVPFDSGLHHAGESVQPPPVTTTASSTAPAHGAPSHAPSTVDDDFAVERALLAGLLPPGFDASRLVGVARRLGEPGLAEELAEGRLPARAIDLLMYGYRATNERGRNTLYIGNLGSLKASIERALRAEYPGRVDPEWLDQVSELLRWRGEPAPPSAASATGPAETDVNALDRIPGTNEGASHPAPHPPPRAPGRTGAGAVTPPPAADPGRIRPPGTSGAPHPVDVDPWSAPPGPGSQVVYTEAIRTPVMSTGAPPGRPGAETPGFARAASVAVEFPFSRREAIGRRFGTEDALREAERALETGGAGTLGWSDSRAWEVLADLHRLNAIFRMDPAEVATMVDVDWSAIEALMRILAVPPPSP